MVRRAPLWRSEGLRDLLRWEQERPRGEADSYSASGFALYQALLYSHWTQEASDYAKEQSLLFFETSAKLGTNIEELFQRLGEPLSPLVLESILTPIQARSSSKVCPWLTPSRIRALFGSTLRHAEQNQIVLVEGCAAFRRGVHSVIPGNNPLNALDPSPTTPGKEGSEGVYFCENEIYLMWITTGGLATVSPSLEKRISGT